MTLRLSMWSGPRNISTAMMRAWENRPDCVVVDEPFYACYLHATGLQHPMTEEIMQVQSSDWAQVADELCCDEVNADIYYQKQMTHHILPGTDLRWTSRQSHCFLIRDPYEVVNSYREKMDSVGVDEIGIQRQWELYQEISEITGQRIPVIDARLVLENPRQVLSAVCEHFNIPFSENMLQWPAGRRESDGVWAPHWYQVVEQSTEFAPYRPKQLNLTESQRAVAEASMPAYTELRARIITPSE